MKSVLTLDETPFALARSFKAGTKLRSELKLKTNITNGYRDGKYSPGGAFVLS